MGSELPDPLKVRLTDAVGDPVPGVLLAFVFQNDVTGGVVSPSVIATDDTGFAAVKVRLGTTTGDQVIEARLANPTSNLSASFGVRALAEKNGNGNGGGGKGKGKGHGGDDNHHD